MVSSSNSVFNIYDMILCLNTAAIKPNFGIIILKLLKVIPHVTTLFMNLKYDCSNNEEHYTSFNQIGTQTNESLMFNVVKT